MEDPILYVVLNKELKMSAGKAAAQTAHAVAMLGRKNDGFTSYNRRTVIVLGAENEAQIRTLHEYLANAGLYSEYYIDEGANEVGAYSVTALACEAIDGNYAVHREIFEPFDLFSVDEGDAYAKALFYLEKISQGLRSYDFMDSNDYTPRVIKKAIKWLRKQK